MKKFLVTGGAGFIGSHMCLTLLEKKFKIVVIDSFINSNPKSLERVLKICESNGLNIKDNLKVIKGDLNNKNLIEEIFLSEKNINEPIEGVIHFAGLKAVNESVSDPCLYWQSNLLNLINLLEVMKTFNCKTIVFSSSATIYGKSNKNLKENDPLNPINPYGNTKLAMEILLKDIYNTAPNDWRIANLRYFNPIGAHPSGLIGESPFGKPNNIFPLILKVAYGQLPSIKVFGKDWSTKDGTPIRDYIHVMDLVEAHLSAMTYLLKNKGQIVNINLGTGKGLTVLDFINSFQRVNKVKIAYEFSNRRKGDVEKLVASNKLALRILNWIPKKGLEDMCRDGWKWKINNPNGYKNKFRNLLKCYI